MDLSSIFPILGFFVGNLLTIIIALAAHSRWQQSRLDTRFKEVWEANDKRVTDLGDARKDFQGAIGRIERDFTDSLKTITASLNAHQIEDARLYVTRAELAERIDNLNGEIKGLREDIRHAVPGAKK